MAKYGFFSGLSTPVIGLFSSKKRENKDQKKILIWTLFMYWNFIWQIWRAESFSAWIFCEYKKSFNNKAEVYISFSINDFGKLFVMIQLIVNYSLSLVAVNCLQFNYCPRQLVKMCHNHTHNNGIDELHEKYLWSFVTKLPLSPDFLIKIAFISQELECKTCQYFDLLYIITFRNCFEVISL